MESFFKKLTVRRSFKREMFIGLLLVALIPEIISSTLLVNVFRSRLKSDYEKEGARQVASVSAALDGYFETIETTTDSIINDKKIVGSLYATDSWEKNKAYTNLFAATEDLRTIAGINVCDREGVCVLSTEQGSSMESLPVYWGILKVAYTHPEEMIIKRAVLPDDRDVLLQTAKAIMVDEDCIGFVVTDIRKGDIESVLYKTYDESNGIAILDSFYEEVYSTKTGVEENLANLVRKRKFGTEDINKSGENIEFFTQDISDTGLTLILGKVPVLTKDITRTMWGVIMVIGIFSLILCSVVASFFSGYLSAPIKTMTKAMEAVRGGDLSTKINSKRLDELGELSKQFDKMTGELQDYMELQVRQQQELNDSNIAMMQAQLNPHFLYNTLDTMKWVAKANQVPKLAKMSADLAGILRTSISATRFVELKDEIELVEKYAEIQQIRFGGSFTFDVELPMELEDCLVPKLIIQPIVENAIIHGLREQDKGHIFVNIYETGGELTIEVSDNGCGIDDEVIEKINSRNRENFKGHIGFYNVDTIIKLYYGESYGIKAERIETGGTMVKITLPIRK